MTGAEIVASYEVFRVLMRIAVPGITDDELHVIMLKAIEMPQYKIAVPCIPESVYYRPGMPPLTRQVWLGVQLVGDTFEITPI